MSNQLKQIRAQQAAVLLLYLAKCKKWRKSLRAFKQSTVGQLKQKPGKPSVVLRDLRMSVNSDHFGERQVANDVTLVSAMLYTLPDAEAGKFLREAVMMARTACHNRFKQQMSSLGLGGLTKKTALQTTALGSYLISLTTVRNLYQVTRFLAVETAQAAKYSAGKTKKYHDVDAEHLFVRQVSSEPSLLPLYKRVLKKMLKRTGMTLKQAKAMPNFIQFQFNMTFAAWMAEFMNDKANNAKVFNLSAAECLNLPRDQKYNK